MSAFLKTSLPLEPHQSVLQTRVVYSSQVGESLVQRHIGPQRPGKPAFQHQMMSNEYSPGLNAVKFMAEDNANTLKRLSNNNKMALTDISRVMCSQLQQSNGRIL